VRRLRRLVNDLQSLSRVEARQVDLNIEPFDLYALAQRVVSQIQPQIIAQNLDLLLESPSTPLLASADPDRVAQVLLNLVGNAVRYTPEGGRITVHMTASGGMARVCVEDTGIGIPPDALPYVFERFYRVDRSRARSSGGSGIGLTIARHLLWAMGGDITVTSAGPGQGSAFCFTLPLVESQPL
jgi:histidine kinase